MVHTPQTNMDSLATKREIRLIVINIDVNTLLLQFRTNRHLGESSKETY